MKVNKTLQFIGRKAQKGELVTFTYTKEDGSVSERQGRFGGNIERRLEKQGTPVNGRGNWISQAKKSGIRSCIVNRGGKMYVRGTVWEKGKPEEAKHKIFILDGISNVR